MKQHYDVIIIGAGPAGIAAAHALKKAGITDLLIIERESEPGGVPRHCQHPTFGLLTFYRPLNGNIWVKKLLDKLGQTEMRTQSTVTAIKPNGELEIASDRGIEQLFGKRIILATGVRETPRHPRRVSGMRPQGVLTTGALQQFIYLRKLNPGKMPVIVGTELVSFSALWTLRSAGIKAVAMIEENNRPTAYRLSHLFARILGVSIHYGSHISAIHGQKRVESVEITDRLGNIKQLACDSVIFSGQFVGEYTLIRHSHLDYDTASGNPLIDQTGRCSDGVYYAVGNMTHPADMGDQCYNEGLQVGAEVARSLSLPAAVSRATACVAHEEVFKMVTPQVIRLDAGVSQFSLNVRVTRPVTGSIVVRAGDRVLYRQRHRCQPARRVLLKKIGLSGVDAGETLLVSLEL